MRDYISRAEFLKEKRNWYCSACDHRKGMKRGRLQILYEIGDAPCRACRINDVLEDLEEYPPADVREVVTCGECVHCIRQYGWPGEEPELWCDGRGWPRLMVTADDFCSKGKKGEADA